jgi:hypothetical protein
VKHAFLVLLLWIVAFVYSARCLEAVIGDKTRKEMKDRLADWWVYVSDSDWSNIIAFAGESTDRLLSIVFGSKILSRRYFLTGGVLAAVLSLIPIVPIVLPPSSFETLLSHWNEPLMHTYMTFGSTLLALNVAFDVASLALSRLVLRDMRRQVGTFRRLAGTFTVLLVSYVTVVLCSIGMQFVTSWLLSEPMFDDAKSWSAQIWFAFVLFLVRDHLLAPFPHDASLTNLIYLPASISSLLLLVVLVMAWLIRMTEPNHVAHYRSY